MLACSMFTRRSTPFTTVYACKLMNNLNFNAKCILFLSVNEFVSIHTEGSKHVDKIENKNACNWEMTCVFGHFTLSSLSFSIYFEIIIYLQERKSLKNIVSSDKKLHVISAKERYKMKRRTQKNFNLFRYHQLNLK